MHFQTIVVEWAKNYNKAPTKRFLYHRVKKLWVCVWACAVNSQQDKHKHIYTCHCTCRVRRGNWDIMTHILSVPGLTSVQSAGMLSPSQSCRVNTRPRNINRYYRNSFTTSMTTSGLDVQQLSRSLSQILSFLHVHTHTYRKLTQPVPGGGAIQTKLKLVEGWWLTWEATTLQTNWVPANWRSGITPGEEERKSETPNVHWASKTTLSSSAAFFLKTTPKIKDHENKGVKDSNYFTLK